MPNEFGFSGNATDGAAMLVGLNVTEAERDLMQAYTVREGAEAQTLINLAKDLKIEVKGGGTPDIKGLQLIAEQRYQHAGRIYTMFSELLNKIDQMKQRLIQKFGQG